MASTIVVLPIDAVDPRKVADFWAPALGWQITEEDDDGVSIAPSTGAWPTIDVFAVPESKSVKNRLHLDLRADGTSTDEEIKRLLQLGAGLADVGRSPASTWTVLADPEDNEFCVLSRTVQDTNLDT